MNTARFRSTARALLVAALFACHAEPSVVEPHGARPAALVPPAKVAPAKSTPSA
jgi:hypothetical protein